MNGYKGTTPTVEAMGRLGLSGNIIPRPWLQWLRFESGKPNSVAAFILSELCYWYRPIEEVDEQTGRTTGWRKKFQADKLRKSYQDLADSLGFTKRQVADNVKWLENKGLITTEFRHFSTCSNVLFIDLCPDEIERISFTIPDSDDPTADRNPSYAGTLDGLTLERDPSYGGTEDHLTLERKTYTENTDPEITSEISPPTPSHEGECEEGSAQVQVEPDPTLISAPSTESIDPTESAGGSEQKTSNVSDPISADPEIPEAHTPSHSKAKKKTGKGKKAEIILENTVYERLKECYNEEKPEKWSQLKSLSPDRIKILKRFVTDHGEQAQTIFRKALQYAKQHDFYPSRAWTFENFMTNGKPLQFAEAFDELSRPKPDPMREPAPSLYVEPTVSVPRTTMPDHIRAKMQADLEAWQDEKHGKSIAAEREQGFQDWCKHMRRCLQSGDLTLIEEALPFVLHNPRIVAKFDADGIPVDFDILPPSK